MNTNPSLFWLRSICFLRCRFYFRAHGPTTVNGFIGPQIRGALGRLLKSAKGCSVFDNTDCIKCPVDIKASCAYDRIFSHESNHIRGLVLLTDPGFNHKVVKFQQGDHLRFDLILVGRDMTVIDEILTAFSRLFIRIGDRRAPFSMVDFGWIDYQGQFQPSYGKIGEKKFSTKEPLTLYNKDISKNPKQIELVFRTPAEVTLTHGTFLKNPRDFSFKVFLMRMVERAGEMAIQLCGLKDREATIAQAKNECIELSEKSVRLVNHNARWQSVTLLNHPGCKRGGVVGRFIYEGHVRPFIPLIDAATCLGVGKNTTHGFGQLSYRLIT